MKLFKPRNILLTFGLYKLGSCIVDPIQGIYNYYLHEQSDLSYIYGKYALVTGGSDGLGKIYVQKLHQMGFNVIVVSRSLDKMRQMAIDLKNVECIQFDFKNSDLTKLLNQLKDKDIGILVNNVGMGIPTENLHKVPFSEQKDIHTVNMLPMYELTEFFKEKMEKRIQKSAIINIGSIAGYSPNPLGSLYASTKSFNNHYSLVQKSDKIDFQLVAPGLMETNMTRNFIKDARIFSVDPEKVVSNSLRLIDQSNFIYGHPWFAIQMAIINNLKSTYQNIRFYQQLKKKYNKDIDNL